MTWLASYGSYVYDVTQRQKPSEEKCVSTMCYLPFMAKQRVTVRLATRDDHYPVCRLDIQQDSECATGYGYPKSALKREPDTDPDIRNAFIDISRIQTFGKSCTLHNHTFVIFIQKHLFSHMCHDSESVYGVFSVSQCNLIPLLIC